MAVRYVGTVRLNFCQEVRYAFFVMVRVRYVGTVRLLCDLAVVEQAWVRVRYVGTLFEFQNLPTKRFMCKVRPSMKIRATVPDVHIV